LLHLDPNLKNKSQNIISKQYLEVTKYYPADKQYLAALVYLKRWLTTSHSTLRFV
jgi:hypothetical protein